MPMIDFRCLSLSCGRCFIQYRPVTSQETPLCETCHGPTERHWVTAHTAPSSVPPVVVFQAPDGSFRFPGNAEGLSAKNYEKQGYQRVELRGWSDVRRFESQVNKAEYAKICRRVEHQQAAQEAGERIRRSDFHHGLHAGFQMPERVLNAQGQIVDTGRMKHVEIGSRTREIARHVMATNNGKRVKVYAPGFHVDVYSNDRSNRDEGRDPRGKRYRD